MACQKGLFGGTGGIFTYLCEMFNGSAVFVDVLSTGITKEPCRTGSYVCTEGCTFDLPSQVAVDLHWTRPIRKVSTLGTLLKKSGTKRYY